MAEQFKDLAELQKYCNSQYELIIELSKKINILEDERDHLKDLLKTFSPNTITSHEFAPDLTDEQIICKAQLKMLKDMSLERELSLEEAKRVEIFTKILGIYKPKSDKDKPKVGDFKNDDLLSLLEESGTSGNLK